MIRVYQGIDVVAVERIRDLGWRHERFLDDVFSEPERAYCLAQADPYVSFAGRFAAKEAVLKLMGTGWRGKIAWTDIEVKNDALGRPEVSLSGEVEKIAAGLGIKQISLSITHTANFAIASAVALAEQAAG